MSTPLYRFKKGTKVKDLTALGIPLVEARKLLKLKSFPNQYSIPVIDTTRYIFGQWEIPEEVTEPIPESGAPAVTPAPRWRVYADEKPTGKGDIYIARVRGGKVYEVDFAVGSVYEHSASAMQRNWPLWMPEAEGLSLFPAVPALKP